jgi:hypothetical protein
MNPANFPARFLRLPDSRLKIGLVIGGSEDGRLFGSLTVSWAGDTFDVLAGSAATVIS